MRFVTWGTNEEYLCGRYSLSSSWKVSFGTWIISASIMQKMSVKIGISWISVREILF
jgi:hypothetical protein